MMKASLWMKYVQRRGMNNYLVQHPLNLINNNNWQAEKSHPPIMDENMTFNHKVSTLNPKVHPIEMTQ
jgi:hypothetical protein